MNGKERGMSFLEARWWRECHDMLLVIFDVKIQQCALALKGALVGIGLFEYALKSFWPSESMSY